VWSSFCVSGLWHLGLLCFWILVKRWVLLVFCLAFMLLVRFLPVILIWDIKIGLVFMDGSSFDKYRKNCNA
jgi:hypothetical protein